MRDINQATRFSTETMPAIEYQESDNLQSANKRRNIIFGSNFQALPMCPIYTSDQIRAVRELEIPLADALVCQLSHCYFARREPPTTENDIPAQPEIAEGMAFKLRIRKLNSQIIIHLIL